MSFHVSLVGRKSLSREIYHQIARAILDGRLRPGDRLSPSRELAESLSVSRMTVNVAYEQLAGEGFIVTRQGAGTFVSDTVARSAHGTTTRNGVIQPRPFWRTPWLPTAMFAQPGRF